MGLFELVHPDAVEPTRATVGSAAYDLTAVSVEWDDAKTKVFVETGVKIKNIPEGFMGAVFPRSSQFKTDCRLSNSVGVIDADYEGTIKLVFDLPSVAAMVISPGNAVLPRKGDKVAQIAFIPIMIEDTTQPEEIRGEGGFGSTDKPKKGAKK